MHIGSLWCVVVVVAASRAERWKWPEEAASVKIDTKVRFSDRDAFTSLKRSPLQDDSVNFHQADETAGFYNRPPGAGRFPVRVETHPYRSQTLDHSDGTLDSLQYCKCVNTPDCKPRHDSNRACGSGQFLCCYKRANKHNPQRTEYFNEIDDERPSLLPGRQELASPFSHAYTGIDDGLLEPDHGRDAPRGGNNGVLVGPTGPAGVIGNSGLLVGPGGPSGVIGPLGPGNGHQTRDVLVGPRGPTGVVGPASVKPDNNLLVGPEGPRDMGHSGTAQRGVLVGPGGPTGVIGPRGFQRPVLIGPGGPTGFTGPRMRGFFNQYMGRQRPGILTGPGGPTGMIGPGRAILTGPGGPTGIIGPTGYFG